MNRWTSHWMALMFKNMSKWIVSQKEFHQSTIYLASLIILARSMEVIIRQHVETVLTTTGTTSTIAQSQEQVAKNSCKMQLTYYSTEEEMIRSHRKTQAQQQLKILKAKPPNKVTPKVKINQIRWSNKINRKNQLLVKKRQACLALTSKKRNQIHYKTNNNIKCTFNKMMSF